ncbi:MAG: hypothetical protein ABFE08_16360 [Armatimonadia bacterium]
MEHKATLYVPAPEFDAVCRECNREQNSDDGTLFDEEVHFASGTMMAVQVCPSKGSTVWTQGVLFERANDGGFYEVGCTGVRDDIGGEYIVYEGDDEYVVTVVRAKQDRERRVGLAV